MKNTRSVNVQYPFPVPARISLDDFALMSDSELHESSRTLHTELNDLYKRNRDRTRKFPTHLWETELAYTQRELSIRAKRREHHERWELSEQETLERELAEEAERDFNAPLFRGNPGVSELWNEELSHESQGKQELWQAEATPQ